MAQSPFNGITEPVNIDEDGLHPTMDRKWLGKNRKTAVVTVGSEQFVVA